MAKYKMVLKCEKDYRPVSIDHETEKAIIEYADYLVKNEGFKIDQYGALVKDGHIYEIEATKK